MPVRIVLADDEAIIRMDLKEMLTSLGYVVVGEAGDGRSAVNLARELRPDLVIMDIQMPDLDGIDAAQELSAESIAPVLLLHRVLAAGTDPACPDRPGCRGIPREAISRE